MFIVGRAVAGVGGAGLINGCINSLTAVAPLEKRPTLMGMIFSVSTIGSVIGPLIGGALTEKLTWRWCKFFHLLAIRIHSKNSQNFVRFLFELAFRGNRRTCAFTGTYYEDRASNKQEKFLGYSLATQPSSPYHTHSRGFYIRQKRHVENFSAT
jgi:MFS family permease